jgi:hypothetical protein
MSSEDSRMINIAFGIILLPITLTAAFGIATVIVGFQK